MKSLPFTLALLIPLFHATRGAGARPHAAPTHSQKVSGACPIVTVSCADYVMRGTSAVFAANVSGGDQSVTPVISWTVSAGTITTGKGQSAIVVDTTDLPTVGRQPLTATVEVAGFAQGCQTKASCTSEVYVIIDRFPVDTYGKLRLSDEHARLDNFAIELLNSGGMSGYIACYGGRRSVPGEAARLCGRAKNYLVIRKKFAPHRITAVEGGYMESPTVVLWILPRGSEFTPSPTVDPSEVELSRGPKKRKGVRVRRQRRAPHRARISEVVTKRS